MPCAVLRKIKRTRTCPIDSMKSVSLDGVGILLQSPVRPRACVLELLRSDPVALNPRAAPNAQEPTEVWEPRRAA